MPTDFKKLLILIAAGIVVMNVAAFMTAVFLTYSLPSEAVAYLTGTTGVAMAVLTAAASFEFASSRGSQAKDETINKLSTTPEPTP